MFIRIKKIKGNPYGYKIKNKWTKKGPRQNKTEYLGRVIMPEKISDSLDGEGIQAKSYNELALAIVKQELYNHGFSKNLSFQRLKVDLQELSIMFKNRPAVIKMNEGFLCNETLRSLINYKPTNGKHEEEIGKELAETFVNAGIQMPPEVFIRLYETLGG